jgi:hypothetical protein
MNGLLIIIILLFTGGLAHGGDRLKYEIPLGGHP